jgi:hypothetical protein
MRVTNSMIVMVLGLAAFAAGPVLASGSHDKGSRDKAGHEVSRSVDRKHSADKTAVDKVGADLSTSIDTNHGKDRNSADSKGTDVKDHADAKGSGADGASKR